MTQRHYSQINLFLRSCIFFCYSVPSIALYGLVCAFTFVIPLSMRHALIRTFLRTHMWMLKKVCHITYSVEGLENIPTDRTGVVLSKHQSTWETFFLPLIFHDPAVILKRELLWIPFFGWGLAASDPIAIDRANKTKAMQQVIEKGKKRLQAGRWVIVFPEGTRVAPGTTGHYRLGGPRLAVATGFPVIPVAHNAGYAWPRRRFIKRPGVIQVVIGPKIESKDRTPEEVLTLAKNWIETTMLRIDGLVDKSTG
jgi:1-acyl-sn-glycerol-3-phosphate acyltransferase